MGLEVDVIIGIWFWGVERPCIGEYIEEACTIL